MLKVLRSFFFICLFFTLFRKKLTIFISKKELSSFLSCSMHLQLTTLIRYIERVYKSSCIYTYHHHQCREYNWIFFSFHFNGKKIPLRLIIFLLIRFCSWLIFWRWKNYTFPLSSFFFISNMFFFVIVVIVICAFFSLFSNTLHSIRLKQILRSLL